MLPRLFLLAALILASSMPLRAQDPFVPEDPDVPDCTWQPFAIFTNGYVKAPSPAAKNEPLLLRKEPSYAAVLPGTAPFDWPNPACNLWPGMRLRIGDLGKPKDRFAKIYYDGLVFWVSKTYRDGSPALEAITSETSSMAEAKPRKRSAPRHSRTERKGKAEAKGRRSAD